MADTLVLNNDGAPLSLVPLSTITWEESIKLWYLDRVDILHVYDDWVVHSPTTAVPVPAVVILREYIKTGKSVIFSRQNILIRDQHICQYCEKSFQQHELTLDHVVPRSQGGKTTWTNVVASCGPCNRLKADRMNMKPKNPPVKPSYFDITNKKKSMIGRVPHESWNLYLGI